MHIFWCRWYELQYCHATVQMLAQVVTHQGSALPYLADHDPEPLPPVHPPGWTLVSAPPIVHPSADAAMQQSSNPPIRASDEQHRAPAFLDGDTPVFYPHGAPMADGGPKLEHHGIPVKATPGSGTMNTDDGRASLKTSFLQWDVPNSTNTGTNDKPVERRAPNSAPETSTSPTHTSPTQWTKQNGRDSDSLSGWGQLFWHLLQTIYSHRKLCIKYPVPPSLTWCPYMQQSCPLYWRQEYVK